MKFDGIGIEIVQTTILMLVSTLYLRFSNCHGVSIYVCQLLRYKTFWLTLFAIMPDSDEGEADDSESGGGLFVPVLRKPRKKAVNMKRANTHSVPSYQTRSQHKKQHTQKKASNVSAAESEHDTETAMRPLLQTKQSSRSP